MTAVLTRLAVLLTILFLAGMVLIRAPAYDDSELRALLAPSGDCALPCFMDITPGLTPLNEALAILDAHQWVDQIETKNIPYVTWTWSGQQPSNIDQQSNGALYASGQSSIVWDIAIRTTFPIASMVLLNGGPTITNPGSNRRRTADNLFVGIPYPDLWVSTFTQLSCPATVRDYWSSWLGLEFRQPRDFRSLAPENITLFC